MTSHETESDWWSQITCLCLGCKGGWEGILMSHEVESDWRILGHMPEPWVQRRPGREFSPFYSGTQDSQGGKGPQTEPECSQAVGQPANMTGVAPPAISTFSSLLHFSFHTHCLLSHSHNGSALVSPQWPPQPSPGRSWCSSNFSADDMLTSFFLKHFSLPAFHSPTFS